MLMIPRMTDTEKNAGDKWGNALNSLEGLMSQSRLQTPHWQDYFSVVMFFSPTSIIVYSLRANNSSHRV